MITFYHNIIMTKLKFDFDELSSSEYDGKHAFSDKNTAVYIHTNIMHHRMCFAVLLYIICQTCIHIIIVFRAIIMILVVCILY